jgi:anti-sigma B factor antagonist
MKMEVLGDTLRISDVTELGSTNAHTFRDWVRSSLAKGQRNIELDLSQATFIDSCGLGALIALHKTACAKNGALRLVSPQPAVRQILELTRMHRIFEIAMPEPTAAVEPAAAVESSLNK